MVPTLLFGGPIVDDQAMALLGVLVAVPVAIARVARSQVDAVRKLRLNARWHVRCLRSSRSGSYTARRQPAMKPEV